MRASQPGARASHKLEAAGAASPPPTRHVPGRARPLAPQSADGEAPSTLTPRRTAGRPTIDGARAPSTLEAAGAVSLHQSPLPAPTRADHVAPQGTASSAQPLPADRTPDAARGQLDYPQPPGAAQQAGHPPLPHTAAPSARELHQASSAPSPSPSPSWVRAAGQAREAVAGMVPEWRELSGVTAAERLRTDPLPRALQTSRPPATASDAVAPLAPPAALAGHKQMPPLPFAAKLKLEREIKHFADSLTVHERTVFLSGHRLTRSERDALVSEVPAYERDARGLRFADEPCEGAPPRLTPERVQAESEADAKSAAFRPPINILALLMDAWHVVDPLYMELVVTTLIEGCNLTIDMDHGPACDNTAAPPRNMLKNPADFSNFEAAFQEDIDRGNCTAWSKTPLFAYAHLVPAGIVPKEDSESGRLVKNYSFGGDSSVNARSAAIVSPYATRIGCGATSATPGPVGSSNAASASWCQHFTTP